MTKKIFFALFLLPFFLMAQDAPEAPSNSFVAEFGDTWQRAIEFTLEVAEAMPADKYDYRPNEEVDTYGGHLVHVIHNWYGLCSRFVTEEDSPLETRLKAEEMTKEQIIEELKRAFEYVTTVMHEMTDEQLAAKAPNFWGSDDATKKVILMLIRDHTTHHRGALVIYLRENGIKPPRFRGW